MYLAERLTVPEQRARHLAALRAEGTRDRIRFYRNCAVMFDRWGKPEAAERFREKARALEALA
jgi:hypothetical protein